jgi:hypothetical protein
LFCGDLNNFIGFRQSNNIRLNGVDENDVFNLKSEATGDLIHVNVCSEELRSTYLLTSRLVYNGQLS